MSLSDLESAIIEFIGDVLVNDCARPEPTKVMRYHGTMPDACCTDDGVLSISWEQGFPSKIFPQRSTDKCVGAPVYTFNIRYVTCWAGLTDVSPEAVVMPDDQWDADAAMLADVADCVARQLLKLACDPISPDPFTAAILEQVMANQFQWIDTTPVRPGGLCAGVTWRVYASLKSGAVAS